MKLVVCKKNNLETKLCTKLQTLVKNGVKISSVFYILCVGHVGVVNGVGAVIGFSLISFGGGTGDEDGENTFPPITGCLV